MKTRPSLPWLASLSLLHSGLAVLFGQELASHPRTATKTAADSVAVVPVMVASDDTLTDAAAMRPKLSPWSREVVKLVEAGIEDRVVLAFVENAGTFNLGADQLIHLSERGVTGDLLSAMLQHDLELASGVRILATSTTPPLDPVLKRTLIALRDAPATPRPKPESPIPTVTPAISSALEPQWAVFGAVESPTMAEATIAPSDPARQENGTLLSPAPAASPKGATSKHSTFYRVPETCSVELVPPIVIVNSASPPPNVIILDLFPGSR